MFRAGVGRGMNYKIDRSVHFYFPGHIPLKEAEIIPLYIPVKARFHLVPIPAEGNDLYPVLFS